MSAAHTSTVRTVMIPWVITLVALFGLTAFVPAHSRSRKSGTPDTIGLFQLAEDTQLEARVSLPLEIIAPPATDGVGLMDLSPLLLVIETRWDQPVFEPLRGTIRGRAPPAMARA